MAIEIYLHNVSDPNYTPFKIYSSDGSVNYDIVPGVIKQEVNKAGTFEFDTYYPTATEYINIFDNYGVNEFITYVSVEDTNYSRYENDRYMFYGRIITIDVELNGHIHIECEGLLADLTDAILYLPSSQQSDRSSNNGMWHLHTKSTDYLFTYALTAYNELMGTYRITKGTIDNENIMDYEGDSEDKWFSYKFPWSRSVGDFIASELINNYGGILNLRLSGDSYGRVSGILDWKADPISRPSAYSNSNNTIIYGDNVLDAKIEKANTNPIRGIFGVGKLETKKNDSSDEQQQQDYMEGYIWTDGFYKVNDEDEGHWGPYIEMGTVNYVPTVKAVNFDQAHTIHSLNKMINRYLNAYCSTDNYTVSVKVLDKYYIDRSVDRIKIMGKHQVSIPFPLKPVNAYLYCLSCEIDIGNLANNTYKFGQYIPPETLNSKYITKG